MSEYEKSVFEQKLALHTAPTLCGMKCANLFSVCHEETPVFDCLKDFSRLAGKANLTPSDEDLEKLKAIASQLA